MSPGASHITHGLIFGQIVLFFKIFNHFNENLRVFEGFSVYFELLLWIVPIFLLFPKSIDSRWICPYLAPN
jgi:hypothetical protein